MKTVLAIIALCVVGCGEMKTKIVTGRTHATNDQRIIDWALEQVEEHDYVMWGQRYDSVGANPNSKTYTWVEGRTINGVFVITSVSTRECWTVPLRFVDENGNETDPPTSWIDSGVMHIGGNPDFIETKEIY